MPDEVVQGGGRAEASPSTAARGDVPPQKDPNLATLTIDGREVTVPKGTLAGLRRSAAAANVLTLTPTAATGTDGSHCPSRSIDEARDDANRLH